MVKDYSDNVFINCPFDEEYDRIREAIIFAVFDCGFVPRCALEEDDSGNVRFEKIKHLIEISKFGIHDICRTELDSKNKLPRFNMPLELGVFVGAKKFGTSKQKSKVTIILDKQQFRYQKYISDIAGHDIRSHQNKPAIAITLIRNWLNNASGRRTIPGGKAINDRYKKFKRQFPRICNELQLTIDEVTYNDYCNIVSDWLSTQE